jgi:CheY-like chemotaxis protein
VKTNFSRQAENQERSHSIEASSDREFERIVESACMVAGIARNDEAISGLHRKNLKTLGESDERLDQLSNWRNSSLFTPREKAALLLSECISLSDESMEHGTDQIHVHFSKSEAVRLTSAITAVNDWLNLHSDSLRVLVVEDNPFDQELLRIQLRKADMEKNVLFVSHAEKALDLLTNPDGEMLRSNLAVIFLDVHLPGMGGVELLRRLRGSSETKHIPVVMLTSSNDPRDIEECTHLGINGYVQKPITYSSFSHAVADVFQHPA